MIVLWHYCAKLSNVNSTSEPIMRNQCLRKVKRSVLK
jgi:hypothetical protein